MKVSIIITSYNYGRYLERCLRSCMNQRYVNNLYEIIVVDDSSTDETSTVLKNYQLKENVRIVTNDKNLGVAASANKGIKLAQGQYVVRVDADDYVARSFVFFLLTYLEFNSDAFCVSCDYIYVSDKGEKTKRMYAEANSISCGIMYRKDVLIEYGLYNHEWRHREEEELRKRLGSYYRIHHLRIPLYRYRKHHTNKTKQYDMMEKFKKKLSDLKSIEEPLIHIEPLRDRRALDKYVVVVIPARGGSKRIKRKNIHLIWGKPMIYWAIKAAKESKYVHDIFVSTEDPEIEAISRKYGVDVITRHQKLSEDRVYKQDVICNAVRIITKEYKKPTLVVSLQANSPQVEASHIDQGIEHLIKYNKNEVMSVDSELNQNAAIRIMTFNTVSQQTLSGHFGVFVADILDVHDKKGIKYLEENFNK